MEQFDLWLRDTLREMLNAELDKRLAKLGHKHGTVTAVDVSGKVKIRFDGEDAATDALFPVAGTYTPTVSDRVYMVPSGATWLVLTNV